MNHVNLVRKDAIHWLKTLTAGSVDAFVTDPPYGVGLKIGTKSKVRLSASIAGDGKLEARLLWQKFIPLMYQAAKDDSLHLVFTGWSNNWALDVVREHFRVVSCIVWHKRPFGLGHFTRSAHEEIFLLAKGKPPRLQQAEADVWTCSRVMRPIHPCQKPVELLSRCIRLVSRPGELVADPFAGIGSTAVAAIEEHRQFIGCEIDARFVGVATTRIRNALNQRERPLEPADPKIDRPRRIRPGDGRVQSLVSAA